MKIKHIPDEVIASMLETFRYEPETGEIIRVKPEDPRRTNRVGKPCGSVSNVSGYKHLGHLKRSYLVHRVVFVLMTGKYPAKYVDHIKMSNNNDPLVEAVARAICFANWDGAVPVFNRMATV